MERDSIEEWSRSLPLPARRRRAIARELQTHLAESQRELELAGWSREDATTESLRRLGNAEEMTEAFARVHRRPRRTKIGLAFGLATTLLLSVYGASASGTLASSTSVHKQVVHVRTIHTAAHSHHCDH